MDDDSEEFIIAAGAVALAAYVILRKDEKEPKVDHRIEHPGIGKGACECDLNIAAAH